MENNERTWSNLKEHMNYLKKLENVIPWLTRSFVQFFNSQLCAKDFIEKYLNIILYFKSIFEVSLNDPNYLTTLENLPYTDQFKDFCNLINDTNTKHDVKNNKFLRISIIFKYLIIIILTYKRNVIEVFQKQQKLSKNQNPIFPRQSKCKPINNFRAPSFDRFFSKNVNLINTQINLLNQELQDFLPRLIPSPALERRLDLKREATCITIMSIIICNKTTLHIFKELPIDHIIFAKMKKKLVPFLLSNIYHDFDITHIFSLMVISLLK
jgi:hypothetical protein